MLILKCNRVDILPPSCRMMVNLDSSPHIQFCHHNNHAYPKIWTSSSVDVSQKCCMNGKQSNGLITADKRGWGGYPQNSFHMSQQKYMLRTFFNPKVPIFFLFFHKNICCRYSLEAPCRGTSNEYLQHMFLWKK